jgi:hypothetical protein
MRPDRPVIGAVVCLATGITLIVAYCHGATGANIAYPFSGSSLHIEFTTTGPAVLGGLVLIGLGILFLAWSLLAAIVSQMSLLFRREDHMESIVGRYRAPSFESDAFPDSIRLTEHKRES